MTPLGWLGRKTSTQIRRVGGSQPMYLYYLYPVEFLDGPKRFHLFYRRLHCQIQSLIEILSKCVKYTKFRFAECLLIMLLGKIMSHHKSDEFKSNLVVLTSLCSWTIWTPPCKKVSSGICWQQRPRSACAFAQFDQGLHYPQTKLFDTTECMYGEQRPG